MSFILQMQRRAIEDLIRDWPVQDLRGIKLADVDFFVNETIGRGPHRKQTPIYCWGVSEGYGSCAGIHHMNVAVFSRCKPEPEEIFTDFEKLQTCYYAVLVSDPFEVGGQIKRRVELLKHANSWSGDGKLAIDFSTIGVSQEYVQLI